MHRAARSTGPRPWCEAGAECDPDALVEGRWSDCQTRAPSHKRARRALRAFFTPELKAKVIELYGVEPSVRFAEVSALIDNEVGVA